MSTYITIDEKQLRTISNGGTIEGMSNKCFFISIKDGLSQIHNTYITVQEILTKSNISIQINEMFDVKTPTHFESVFTIAEKFDLRIFVYAFNEEEKKWKISRTNSIWRW